MYAIRVVDPTQLNRLQNHSSGDGKSEETLKDLASRQFRFKMDASLPPTLTEYSSLSDAKANRNGVVYEMTHHIYKEKVTLSVDQLHRNKYYKVTILATHRSSTTAHGAIRRRTTPSSTSTLPRHGNRPRSSISPPTMRR